MRTVEGLGSSALLRRMDLGTVLRGRGRLARGDRELRDRVHEILDDVADRGDGAVAEFTRTYDGIDVSPDRWWLGPEVCELAFRASSATLQADLVEVARRVRVYEDAFAPSAPGGFVGDDAGFCLGLIERPVGRAACYVPAGTAPLVSTVLMGPLVAREAGVEEVVVATPPRAQGVSPAILAACHVAGVGRVLTVGGAQAIAALALGTETIPRQDVITGPGNRYVTEAKRQVYGLVGTDGLAGPSEVLVVADEGAEPRLAALDLLAQAEHDVDAVPILVTIGEATGVRILAELAVQVASLPRREIALHALASGAWIVCADSTEALKAAGAIGPEHLELMIGEANDPAARAGLLQGLGPAGAVFLGTVAEAFGDYVAGPSHVLPTAGAARFSSPLGRRTFLRRTSVVGRDPDGSAEAEEAFAALARTAARLARVEGLEGHARAAEARAPSSGASVRRTGDRLAVSGEA